MRGRSPTSPTATRPWWPTASRSSSNEAVVHRGRLRLGHGPPEVHGHQVPRSPACAHRRLSSWPPSGRSRCTAAWATSCAGQPLDPALLEEDPEAVRRGRGEPRPAHRHRGQLRRARGRGHQHLPHGPRVGVRGRARSRAGRGRRGTSSSRATSPRAARGPWTWPAPSGRRPRRARRTSASCRATDASLREQIEDIATRVYGADGVDFSPQAQASLDAIERLGYGRLPVCMAKTQSSLTHDPALKGRPRGWRLPDPRRSALRGRGFVTAYCGNMMTMPGPADPPGRRGRGHRRRRPDRRASSRNGEVPPGQRRTAARRPQVCAADVQREGRDEAHGSAGDGVRPGNEVRGPERLGASSCP